MIPEIEKASQEDIKAFQEIKLKELIQYLAANSPYYKRIFEENTIIPETICGMNDLQKLPVTTKEQLQQFNKEFICVPKSEIVDYVTTSGTLGDPVTFALTNKDLDRLAYNEAISLACSEITKEDVVQLMTTMDRRFMAGLAYFLGARELGAGIIRVGSGVPELQWDSILKFNPTYLITVPSFLLKLIEYAQQNNIDLKKSGVKGAICIGEPIREQDFSYNTLAERIVSQWDIKLYATYASTEMSTAFNECKFQIGGHHHPELILIEILDEFNKPVPKGKTGELVVTTLGVEAMPLLRFKTGDMVTAHAEACSCGRNTLRLGPVLGRKQHMIKYKGTTLYPPALFNVLSKFNEIDNFVFEISSNDLDTDEILVKIGTVNPSEELLKNIKDHFRAKLRVTPTIEFHHPDIIETLRFPGLSRKPQFIIDYRTST